jgi:hypothetical protein
MPKQEDQQNQQNKPEETKKVVTRYERRLAKRKKEEEKIQLEKRIAQIVGLVLIVVLVAVAVSFPIRSYTTIHQNYLTVDGDKVSRLEYDYNYYTVFNNYINQYGNYLSYFGLDITQDLSTQMYSETMSWKDYFDQMAVESLKQNRALMKDAKAKGFTYDTAEDYKKLKEGLQNQAESYSVSESEYMKGLYGPYATFSRLDTYLNDTLYLAAYYEQLDEEHQPTDEAIQAYYEEHTEQFDSVDYKMTEVAAVLPTAPTDETATTAEAGEASSETEATDTEEAYEPTEEEVAAAMAEAKIEADAALETISSQGTLYENVKQSELTTVLRDWMFDSVRKGGDTNVIEDTSNNKYYVVEFVKRYLDQTPTADARVITVAAGEGQDILDEWQAGDATEDSFISLYQEYSSDASGTTEDDSLFSNLSPDGMQEDMSAWIFADGRQKGDATVITVDTQDYVVYYVGQGDPQWKSSIRSQLLSEAITAYVDDLTANMTVEDPKGHLPYLKAAAETQDTTEAVTDTAETEGTSETVTETAGEESTAG